MKRILLKTNSSSGFWKEKNEIEYTGLIENSASNYEIFTGWKTLSSSCPIYGIGYYFKGTTTTGEEKFSYIKILSIERTSVDSFKFTFEHLRESMKPGIEIKKLLDTFHNKKGMITVLSDEQLKNLLKEIEETPPENWL